MVEKTSAEGDSLFENRNRRLSIFKLTDVPCLRCGTCCRKYQPWLTAAEISILATYLGDGIDQFIDKYTDRRWPGTQSFLISQRNGACLFLQDEPSGRQSLCGIHTVKPACCRAWNAGLYRPECQYGLKTIFGLEVDRQGCISGPPDLIRAFEAAIKGLTVCHPTNKQGRVE